MIRFVKPHGDNGGRPDDQNNIERSASPQNKTEIRETMKIKRRKRHAGDRQDWRLNVGVNQSSLKAVDPEKKTFAGK